MADIRVRIQASHFDGLPTTQPSKFVNDAVSEWLSLQATFDRRVDPSTNEALNATPPDIFRKREDS